MAKESGETRELVSIANDIARLLALNLTRDTESQSEAIKVLHDYGFEPTRIADLLGAKYNSVYKSLKRAGRLE